jgi:DNA-binding response OmpR family regulator
VHRSAFIAVVAHGSDLWRKDGAASCLRALGAPVRTLALWSDPDAMFRGDDDGAVRALIVETLDRPDLGIGALRTLRRHPRLERVGALLAVTVGQVTCVEPSCGFDDFVLFPYVADELYARVCELERRRGQETSPQRVAVGDLVVDPASHEVILGGRHVHLSALAFDVLAYLAKHRGRLVSREELLKQVWGANYLGGARAVDVCVCHLRATLGAELPLTTVRAAGYRLEMSGSVPVEPAKRYREKVTTLVAKPRIDVVSSIVVDQEWRARGGSRSREKSAAQAAHDLAQSRTFIKVMEVWVPNDHRTHLERSEALYGPHDELDRISAPMRFAPGEGLLGRAWAQHQPIVLGELRDSYFKRTEAAVAAHMNCAVALPIFSGEFLLAVVLFLCGDEEEHVGAIELWENDPASRRDMGLVDGYYGTAASFEKDSLSVTFRPGLGLPGRVWKSGMPVIMEDLGRSRQFVRSKSALEVGIDKGLGIPYWGGAGEAYVMTFLSSTDTPIARRFEVWVPTRDPEALVFSHGQCDVVGDLAAVYASVRVRRGHGLIGRVALTGVPSVSSDLASSATESARSAGLSSAIALPIIEGGRLKCVVVWYF